MDPALVDLDLDGYKQAVKQIQLEIQQHKKAAVEGFRKLTQLRVRYTKVRTDALFRQLRDRENQKKMFPIINKLKDESAQLGMTEVLLKHQAEMISEI